MVNGDAKKFSFGNMLNHNIFQNQQDTNVKFLCLGWKNIKFVFDKVKDNLLY